MARCSQTSELRRCSNNCRCSRFSSAIADATLFLDSMSCSFISTINWLSIFSGFSALVIMSLMLERTTRRKRSNSPIR